MIASELIAKLQEGINRYGDRRVCYSYCTEIEAVYVEGSSEAERVHDDKNMIWFVIE